MAPDSNTFPWLAPTEEQIKAIWVNPTIIIDTNVLLDLYKIRPRKRDDFIQAMTAVKADGCLWFPHRVYYEFHRNRDRLLGMSNASPDRLVTELRTSLNTAINFLDAFKSNGHPDIDPEGVRKDVDEMLKKVCKAIEEQKKAAKDHDPIIDAIDLLFDKVVLPRRAVSDGVRAQLVARAGLLMPPGISDFSLKKGKFGDDRLADVIIWLDAVEAARDRQTSGLLIVSEDGGFSEDGEASRPLARLLIEEAWWEYGVRAWRVNAKGFRDGMTMHRGFKKPIKPTKADRVSEENLERVRGQRANLRRWVGIGGTDRAKGLRMTDMLGFAGASLGHQNDVFKSIGGMAALTNMVNLSGISTMAGMDHLKGIGAVTANLAGINAATDHLKSLGPISAAFAGLTAFQDYSRPLTTIDAIAGPMVADHFKTMSNFESFAAGYAETISNLEALMPPDIEDQDPIAQDVIAADAVAEAPALPDAIISGTTEPSSASEKHAGRHRKPRKE